MLVFRIDDEENFRLSYQELASDEAGPQLATPVTTQFEHLNVSLFHCPSAHVVQLVDEKSAIFPALQAVQDVVPEFEE